MTTPGLIEELADAIAKTEFVGDWQKDSVLTEGYTAMARAALAVVIGRLRNPDNGMMLVAVRAYSHAAAQSSRSLVAKTILDALASHLEAGK